MSKRLKVPLFFILIAIIISVVYAVYFHVPVTKITYSESNTVLTNPSRGFYVQFDTGHLEGMNKLRDQGVTLVFLAFDIAEFVDSDITEAKLKELSLAFDTVRANGLKVIFRAAYGFYDPQKYSDPESIDRILTHIRQLSPILQKHQEVLLSVQAGFLGQWGEWHHSNLETITNTIDDRVINELLKALCEAVPQPITIALRRPSFIRKVDPTQIDMSRIAFHNDALLSGDSDMNTYDLTTSTRENELNFIKERGYPLANGGEMPQLSAYTQPDVAMVEFSKLNLTYLNREYNRIVLDEWEMMDYDHQRFMDVLNNTLGYRLSLKSATIPQKFRKDQTLKIRLTLSNTGFSAMSLPYRAELVIYDASGLLISLPLDLVNLQEVGPQASQTITFTFNSKVLPDQFTIGLSIKENREETQEDVRYMVQLANDELTYHDGIHDLVSYQWDGKSKYILLKDGLR